MSLVRASAVVTLVLSLGANAFFAQALSRRSVPPEQPAASDEGAPPAEAPAPAAPAIRPPASGQARGSVAAATAGPVNLQEVRCAAQLASMEESMAQKSEALRGVLPPEPLFARGQSNPDAQRLLAPIVAQVVARAGATGQPTLECKDVACKLVFTAPASIDDDAWDQALATSAEFQAWSQQFTLGPVTPAGEAATKQKLVQRSLFFKLNGPRAVAAQGALVPGNGGR